MHPPILSYEERQALFIKCKTHLVKHYPSGWFLTPNMKRDNIVHWTLWALFASETMRPEWEEEVDGYVREVENILGRRLEAGYSEEAKSLRLTFDPVVTLHRPILWYLVSTSRSIRQRDDVLTHLADRLRSGYILFSRAFKNWVQALRYP